MTKQYNDEFKAQVLKEVQEIGNAAGVARRYELSPNTIYTWMRAARQRGSTEALSRDLKSRTAELEKRLAKVSSENAIVNINLIHWLLLPEYDGLKEHHVRTYHQSERQEVCSSRRVFPKWEAGQP